MNEKPPRRLILPPPPEPRQPPGPPPAIEAPSLAQKHHAHLEQVALKLAAGESMRHAMGVLLGRGVTPAQAEELAPLAIARAREIIAANRRRDRTQGSVWTVLGTLPLLVFTAFWFRYHVWNQGLVILVVILAFPALLQGLRLLARKPTEPPALAATPGPFREP